MSTDREFEVRATSAEVEDDSLRVSLEDGRHIEVPLWWYPKLLAATKAQRRNWRLLPGGYGIRWPEVDEDIGVWALLAGRPAPDAVPPASTAGAIR